MKKVLDIAKRVRDRYDPYEASDLDCMCAVVSAELSVALKEAGIKHTIAEADDNGAWCHVFIVVRGKILDLTARQFSPKLPAIVFRKLEEEEEHWWWKIARYHDSPEELVLHQKKAGWPLEQINRRILKQAMLAA